LRLFAIGDVVDCNEVGEGGGDGDDDCGNHAGDDDGGDREFNCGYGASRSRKFVSLFIAPTSQENQRMPRSISIFHGLILFDRIVIRL
jgi:hypothetical protein